MAKVRSATALTIAPAALAAALIGSLLALRLAGLGFEGDSLDVVREAAPDDRLWEVAERRGPVVGIAWLAWLVAFAAAFFIDREGAGRWAARLAALSLAYLPLALLAGAALEPSVGEERLLVALSCPVLAALTLAVFGSPLAPLSPDMGQRRQGARGYRPLAVACAVTVFASAADLIAGSPLTQLSLAGPNPAGGHRYYGIGNELEAILVVLVLVGTGAALTGCPRLAPGGFSPRGWGKVSGRAPAAFLVAAVVFAFVFAYGRYGADVGAAIVLPLGGAVAAALLAGRRDLALWALAVPIPALAVLVAADLLSGSDAHLTETVLQADGGRDVLAVIGRRLGEAAESFGRPLLLAGLPLVLAAAALAWRGRERIAAWLGEAPALQAGLAGALAATLVGTVANDSGALLLELGALYLAAFLGYAWAESEG